jgi:hypothetical protein
MTIFSHIISSFIDHPTIRGAGSIVNNSQKKKTKYGLLAPSEDGSTKATQGARQAYDEGCPFDLLPLSMTVTLLHHNRSMYLSMKGDDKCINIARNFHVNQTRQLYFIISWDMIQCGTVKDY